MKHVITSGDEKLEARLWCPNCGCYFASDEYRKESIKSPIDFNIIDECPECDEEITKHIVLE